MTTIEQLNQWVDGKSVHNPDRDECCPDFSCCNPALLSTEEERRNFKQAFDDNDDEILGAMLTIFLGRLLEHSESVDVDKVEIVG